MIILTPIRSLSNTTASGTCPVLITPPHILLDSHWTPGSYWTPIGLLLDSRTPTRFPNKGSEKYGKIMTNQERIENMGCQFVYLVLFAHPCKLHVNPNKGLEKYGKIITNNGKFENSECLFTCLLITPNGAFYINY